MRDPDTQAWLEAFLARHDAVAGTVHVERDNDLWPKPVPTRLPK